MIRELWRRKREAAAMTPPSAFGQGAALPQRQRTKPLSGDEGTCKGCPDPYGPDPIVFGPRSDRQAPEEMP